MAKETANMPSLMAMLFGIAVVPDGGVNPSGNEPIKLSAPALLTEKISITLPATLYNLLLAGSNAGISAPLVLDMLPILLKKPQVLSVITIFCTIGLPSTMPVDGEDKVRVAVSVGSATPSSAMVNVTDPVV